MICVLLLTFRACLVLMANKSRLTTIIPFNYTNVLDTSSVVLSESATAEMSKYLETDVM